MHVIWHVWFVFRHEKFSFNLLVGYEPSSISLSSTGSYHHLPYLFHFLNLVPSSLNVFCFSFAMSFEKTENFLSMYTYTHNQQFSQHFKFFSQYILKIDYDIYKCFVTLEKEFPLFFSSSMIDFNKFTFDDWLKSVGENCRFDILSMRWFDSHSILKHTWSWPHNNRHTKRHENVDCCIFILIDGAHVRSKRLHESL